jgi:2-polyprenyl-3-methyl-5-hydroxy-6-metoxy-1,4-benzoquinol methylase
METDQVRTSVENLFGSLWAFSALSYAIESGILEDLKEPRTISDLNQSTGVPSILVERVCDILASLNFLQRQEDIFKLNESLVPKLSFIVAQVRAHSVESLVFIDRAKQPAKSFAWDSVEPAIIQSRGVASASWAASFFKELIPGLGDLAQRVKAPSASFMDVGTGVGAISIAMCRALPALHAVGLDILDTPLVIARRNAASAGLADRIDFRKQDVQDMNDSEAFDLAFFPQMFMTDDVVKRGLANTWRALRHGGWVLVSVGSIPGMSLQASISRLRDTLAGGSARIPSQVQSMLVEAGFTSVSVFDASETAKLVYGQRPA